MLSTEPRENAAAAIVRRLIDDEALESDDPAAVASALGDALFAYEREIEALARVARETNGAAARQAAFDREAAARGFVYGDDALDGLRTGLVAALEASPAVSEVFAEDAALERVVSAALYDYVAAIETRRLAALRDAPRVEPPKPTRRPTLADLGFPFPLFEGPVDDASVDDAGPCRVCRLEAPMRFERACYACFRAGKAPNLMDTEHGALLEDSAETGLTQGLPGDDEDAPWIPWRTAPEHLRELTRTPSYTTWQGSSWLFCDDAPMIFVGAATRELLEAWATEASTSIDEVVRALLAPERIDTANGDAARFLDSVMRGSRTLYAFRCATCNRRRAHWDMT